MTVEIDQLGKQVQFLVMVADPLTAHTVFRAEHLSYLFIGY